MKNGEAAAILVNDIQSEIKLRRIYKNNNQITLRGDGPNCNSITLPKNKVKILGKCIMIDRKI